MIDFATEALLTLAQAADELPRRRRGRKTHVSTLFRWSSVGCKGIVLDTIQIGGTRCTSREALSRFFAQLSTLPAGGSRLTTPIVSRSVLRRRRDSERAAAELESLGA
jgi:hypothetical protein